MAITAMGAQLPVLGVRTNSVFLPSMALRMAPALATARYTISAGTTLSQSAPGILTGSSDPNTPPQPLSVGTISGSAANVGTAVTLPSGATLTVQANGSFVYVPASSFAGSDSFTFQAFDGIASSNVATVSIVVYPVNLQPPVANNDSYATPQNTELSISAPAVLASWSALTTA